MIFDPFGPFPPVHRPAPYFLTGDQAADEEGVHPGVLQRQEVHVSLLLPCQVCQSPCGKQDVRQSTCVTYNTQSKENTKAP